MLRIPTINTDVNFTDLTISEIYQDIMTRMVNGSEDMLSYEFRYDDDERRSIEAYQLLDQLGVKKGKQDELVWTEGRPPSNDEEENWFDPESVFDYIFTMQGLSIRVVGDSLVQGWPLDGHAIMLYYDKGARAVDRGAIDRDDLDALDI